MRVMGLDYGSKTVGVALSDELLLTAQPLETIFRKEENKLRKTCQRLEAIIEENGVKEIVMGYPLHMDGSMSETAAHALAFKEMLERRTGIEILLVNEQLTTQEANEILAESGIKKEDRKAYIDRIAAGFILQDYLNNRKKD